MIHHGATAQISTRRAGGLDRNEAHRISPLPVLIGVVALENTLRDMPALLYHELVERVGKVPGRYPPEEHFVIGL
jgi:hypothetical protein